MSASLPIHHLGVAELSRELAAGNVTSVEVTTHLLERIAILSPVPKPDGPQLGAFLEVGQQQALEAAQASDLRRSRGELLGPLDGIPLGHKDVFVTTDFCTTAASKMLAGYRSPFDATVVSKLKSAGMVTVGKLNCDEFAMGGSNENSAFFPARNPWLESRIPGGSSGGSAAAVAARLLPAATGTDTGGSVRQPAALCGVTGIKPTYGRCSRFGMIAFASSLDQAGPIARSAEDCALMLQAMSGFDPLDSTSAQQPVPNYPALLEVPRPGATDRRPLEGLRIGFPREWGGLRGFFGEDVGGGAASVASNVATQLEGALNTLQELGATVVLISLPKAELSIPVYYILAPAEASSNLNRYDGVRFGSRAEQYGDLVDMYKKSRSAGFGDEVKRRIMIGTYVLSHGYYDAYYLQAQKLRRMIVNDFQSAFAQCDLIAGPVAPTIPRTIGSPIEPVAEYLADVFTLPASLAGLPAMSIPAGLIQGTFPVGLQLIGNYWQEAVLLHTAHAFQQRTSWHAERPGHY